MLDFISQKDNRHVVIVGHGSSRRPDAAASTLSIGKNISEFERFAGVHCAFMKQDVNISSLFKNLPNGIELEIVPHFAAAGTFVKDRLESYLSPERKRFNATKVHAPLGLHPGIAMHLKMLSKQAKVDDIILVAHGSTTSIGPALTAQNLCQELQSPDLNCHVLFLSNEPHVNEWRNLNIGRNVLVCPLFAGAGAHLCEDIPQAFALKKTPLAGMTYDIDDHRIQFEFPLMNDHLLTKLALDDLGFIRP